MTDHVETLVERLSRGESLDDVLRSLISPAERELLGHCAVVRAFDRDVVEEVFRLSLPPALRDLPSFEHLVRRAEVKQVAEGVYRLREGARREYFDSWWDGEPRAHGALDAPARLRELSGRLAEYYARRGPEWGLEVLYHNVAARPAEALARFEELYAAADAAFDLALCQDLISVFEDRPRLMNADMRAAIDRRRAHLRARSLWSREYYQTVNYYELPGLAGLWGEVLDDPARWILHVHAPGGMGKTMFIRWLVARRCVPERVPCALLDFDRGDVMPATRDPLRMLLQVAEMLNEQTIGQVFGYLIDELKPLLSGTPERSDGPARYRELSASQSSSWALRFASALSEAPERGPLVLIFDTLEEVVLYQQGNLLRLIEFVSLLREQYPNVRLLLAGRYNLADEGRLPDFAREFGGQTRTLTLRPFTEVEALGYLREKRGLPPSPAHEAAVGRSGGNPFKLAVFADLLRDDPTITAAQIRAYPTADLLYLIRRVVVRIRNPNVRWLLRYGVVPRRLTRSFVSAVMRDFLPRAISGSPDLDDPRRDLPRELSGENPFEHSAVAGETLDLNQLWRTLISYAADYSWVSVTDQGGDDALSFHQDVLNPMRDLLRKHPVYAALHRAAADYFTRRAEEEPVHRVVYTREVIYHRFQLEGEGAGGFWEALMESPSVGRDPEARRAFAEEVCGPEYVDDEHRPLPHGDGSAVSTRTLARAFFEQARAKVELARARTPSLQGRLWQEAQSAFRAFELIQEGWRGPAAPPWRVLVVRAALQSREGESARALKSLQRALKIVPRTAERVEVESELARLCESAGQYGEAAAHYRAAVALRVKLGDDEANVWALSLALAHSQRLNQNFDEAVRVYRSILEGARESGDTALEVETRLALGETFLEMNLPAAADKCLAAEPLFTGAPRSSRGALWPSRILLVLGRARLAQREVPEAADLFMKAVSLEDGPWAEGDEGREELYRLAGEAWESYGAALAQMLRPQAAFEAFERARNVYGRLNDEGGADKSLLLMAEAQLRAVGSVKEAGQTLEQAGRFVLRTPQRHWLEHQLLLAEVYRLSGSPAEAGGILRHLSAVALGENWGPALRFRIDAARLSVYRRLSRPDVLGEMLRSLREVSPPSARFGLLRPLVWSGPWGKTPPEFVPEFEALFPLPPADDDDFPAHAAALAEILRVLGQRKRSALLLRQAFEDFRARGNLFGAFEVLSAYNRVEGRTQALAVPELLRSFVEAFLRQFQDHGMFCAALLVEHGHYLLKRRELDEADDALLRAEPLIEAEGRESQWQSRAFELRARVAAARVDAALKYGTPVPSSLTETSADALALLERAAGTQELLGNAHEYRRLLRGISVERQRQLQMEGDGAPFEPSASAEFKHESDPRWRGYIIRIRQPKKGEPQVEVRVGHQGLLSRWRHRFWRSGSTGFDQYSQGIEEIAYGKLSELLAADFRRHSSPFIELLDPLPWALRESRVATDSTLQDMRLEIRGLSLAALPWELFIRNHSAISGLDFLGCLYRGSLDRATFGRPIARLQRALNALYDPGVHVSGRYDWRTADAVRGVQSRHGLPATGVADDETRKLIKHALRGRFGFPSALVVAPDDNPRKSRRGREYYGLEVAHAYRSEGFRLDELNETNLSYLSQVLKDRPFEVIHLCPVVRFSTQLGVYLDFSNSRDEYYEEKDPSASGKLTLTGLNQLLKAQRGRRPGTTLVVLDVARPPGPVATFNQLLLRNAFASELFRMGGADAVIATGLGDRLAQELLTAALVKSVSGGETLGETIVALANIPRLNSDDVLEGGPQAGVALFAHDPRE